MKFRIQKSDYIIGRRTAFLNIYDAEALGVKENSRIIVDFGNYNSIFFVSLSKNQVNRSEVIITADFSNEINDEFVNIMPAPPLKSVDSIKRKIYGKKLLQDDFESIIKDINDENLSQIELSSYVTSLQTVGLDDDEIIYLINSMVSHGEKINFEYEVYDVHSIGGVPGNKYALITVPILASLGLKVPKTSSKAITSAAGTADVMEVLANVNLKAEEIKKIVDSVGATLTWGGSINIAPADDKIIKVEQPLGIDPIPQLISSVLSKKVATSIRYLLIDIPMGNETKVQDEQSARSLAEKFIRIGNRIGLKIECAITYGGQPLGRAIGPAIEAQEALRALEGKQTSNSFIVKSLEIAALMLEISGISERGEGIEIARDTLRNGKAREKFFEIVNAQGSKGIEKSEDIQLGEFTYDILSGFDGYISYLSNRSLVEIARILGAPHIKEAGLWVYKKIGDKVEKNEPVLRLYSKNKEKLEQAVRLSRKIKLYSIEGMVIENIPDIKRSKRIWEVKE
ncbi:MAG: AMP phosphorylase [Thermoplasmata archaeon]|nr:AMP phosphorylase [Thermoplasmata archaeon]